MNVDLTRPGQARTRRYWTRYGLGFLLLAFAFLALIAYQIYNARAVATANATVNVKNLTLVLESTLEQALTEAQDEVITVATEIEVEAMRPANASRYRPQVTRWLKSHAAHAPTGLALRVFDANGDSLYSSKDNEPAFNIADRNYFQQLKADPSIQILFSDVFAGRVTRQPAVFVVKAVRDGSGAFLGIVLNGVELSNLHHYFGAIELGTEGTVAMRRLDNGAFVVRYPGGAETANQPAMDLPIRAALLKDGRPGAMEVLSPVDRVRRIYGYRRLGDLPFFVTVGTSANDYLSGWRQTVSISLLASLLFLASLAAVFLRLARAEARREQAMALLTQILETINVGIFLSDEQGRITRANPAMAAMFHSSIESMIGVKYESLVHPLDLDAARMNAIRVRSSKVVLIDVDRRYIRADQTQFWGNLTGRSFQQEGLSDRTFVYAITDITERKDAEEAQRIAATAFESQQGMTITDAQGTILKVNQAFTEVTGYSAEEVIGKNPRLLNSGRQDAVFYAAMWDSIHRSGSWQGEIWNRRKSGEIYPEWLTLSEVKDAEGMVTHYVGAFSDLSDRKAAESQIQDLAFSDRLTGLPNRRLLLDRLQQAITVSVRHQRKGALLMVDLDDFKSLNDSHGHDKGDLLLQQVAKSLSSRVRDGDTVARVGGDEFVVLLEGLSASTPQAATQAEALGDKMLKALNQTYVLAGYEHHSTASIGVTLIGEQSESVEEPLKRCELAMYQAKAAGRNVLRFFDPQMQAVVTARTALEAALREALVKDQFLLYYQPQVNEQQQITGMEALVRWFDPKRGLVSPTGFIALAEETGLILPLGEWVLEAACTQLALWAGEPAMAHLTVAVNVSARQFHQNDFVDQVLAVVDYTGANPRRLKLELTESLLVTNVEAVIAKMNALKGRGMSFSLDDFGTGYSSLSYLKRLPLHQLKIDQGFVRDILTDPNDAAIAKMVVALAESLGLEVIAEGVETEAQRSFLASLGCHDYQGYLFSRPLPLAEFEAFALRMRTEAGNNPGRR